MIMYFLPCTADWLAFADFKGACIFISIGIVVRKALNRERKTRKRNVKWQVGSIIIIVILNLWLMQIDYMQTFVGVISAMVMIMASWQLATLIRENPFTLWISKH